MDKEKNKNEIKDILESKNFKRIIYILGILAIVFIIFQAGMIVGFRKASFGRDWGANYEDNFGSPHKFIRMKGGDLGDFGNLPNAHGAVGKIIRVELPTVVVFDGKDQTEKIIIIDDKTEIRRMRDIVTKDELQVDAHIIVIGAPNAMGQIEAKLVRFIPAPPELPITNN